MAKFEVAPDQDVLDEIEQRKVDVDGRVREAQKFLDDPDVDDVALARMFLDEGYSEKLAYWIVREAEVRRAPG